MQTVSYDFHTDKWAEAYGKRIDEMIAELKTNGVPVLWIGLPAIRGTRTIGDISYLNELYRKRAEKAGITYVNIWDGFVDEAGKYSHFGPDYEGQMRRLRSSDDIGTERANRLGRFLQLAFFGELGQRFFDSGKTFVEIFLVDLQHFDVEARRSRDLGNPGTHQAAAQHANLFDFHKTCEFISGNGVSATSDWVVLLCVLCGKN